MTTKTLPSNKIQLTEEQQKAINDLLEWVNKPYNKESTIDDLYCTLQGFAGTGKTTCLNEFLKNLPSHLKYSVVATAPTHKAKKILSKITGLTAYTIQKLLGLKPNTNIEDFDINNVIFDKLSEPTIYNYKVIVIDEFSMLNEDLANLLFKESEVSKTKILFIGDPYQIPPVGEKETVVLKKVKNNVYLKTVIRQQNTNPISNLLFNLREDITNYTNTFLNDVKIPITNINKNTNEGYFILDKQEFLDKVVELFTSDAYKINKDFVKFIAYRNSCISAWNQFIRKNFFNISDEDNINNPIIVGDNLMSYSNISINVPLYGLKTILTNSDDYVVKSVVNSSINDILVYETKLYNIDTDKSCEIYIVNPKDYNNFTVQLTKYLRNAKQFKQWKKFYDFKNKFILLHDLSTEGEILTNDATKLVGKDLDYGYAITAHKSQGSTYENAIVNIVDINVQSNIYEKLRLINVAISRAKKQTILNLIH